MHEKRGMFVAFFLLIRCSFFGWGFFDSEACRIWLFFILLGKGKKGGELNKLIGSKKSTYTHSLKHYLHGNLVDGVGAGHREGGMGMGYGGDILT
jgi:hypothetical protein